MTFRKHLITSTFAVALLSLATAKAHAADTSLETLVGTQRVDTDFLVVGSPAQHTKIIVRDLPKVNYRGQTANFLLGRFEVGDIYGFSLGVEGQHGDAFTQAWPTLDYRCSWGNFSLFAETAMNHTLAWEQTVITNYSRGQVQFTFEGVATMDRGQHLGFATLPRIRYHFGEHYAVGVGVNTNHTAQAGGYTHSINPGLTAQIKF